MERSSTVLSSITCIENLYIFVTSRMLKTILNSSDSKRQKSLGRHVTHFDAGQWRIECQQVFKEGHYGKKK